MSSEEMHASLREGLCVTQQQKICFPCLLSRLWTSVALSTLVFRKFFTDTDIN